VSVFVGSFVGTVSIMSVVTLAGFENHHSWNGKGVIETYITLKIVMSRRQSSAYKITGLYVALYYKNKPH